MKLPGLFAGYQNEMILNCIIYFLLFNKYVIQKHKVPKKPDDVTII